jgi:hypothetical protein
MAPWGTLNRVASRVIGQASLECLVLAEAVEKLFWGLKFQHFREYAKIKSNKIKGIIIRLSAILAKIRSKKPIWGVFQQPRLISAIPEDPAL